MSRESGPRDARAHARTQEAAHPERRGDTLDATRYAELVICAAVVLKQRTTRLLAATTRHDASRVTATLPAAEVPSSTRALAQGARRRERHYERLGRCAGRSYVLRSHQRKPRVWASAQTTRSSPVVQRPGSFARGNARHTHPHGGRLAARPVGEDVGAGAGPVLSVLECEARTRSRKPEVGCEMSGRPRVEEARSIH
ncbi:hypothetical protein FB451DRAFT_1268925 [Mycena latifolia]|nr:hypothetical protein FB451DRAFT_1268925 [Mycena latifolia]